MSVTFMEQVCDVQATETVVSLQLDDMYAQSQGSRCLRRYKTVER
jgi:hypothetical protein